MLLAIVPWWWGYYLRRSASTLRAEITQRITSAEAVPALSQNYNTTIRIVPMEAWTVIRKVDHRAAAVSGKERTDDEVVARFRLAGTIHVCDTGVEGGRTEKDRRAVVEDREMLGKVFIVKVGDRLADGVRVRAIEPRRVRLDANGHEVELRLHGRNADEAESEFDESGNDPWSRLDLGNQVILSESRLGVQIEDRRWVLDRRRVMDYYQEVLDDGDRLVAVFDSFKPLRNDQRRIDGYILVPEGEREFFEMVGLKEGDIVRKVNSMPMTSRRIAEAFIRDFANGKLGAVVLEVEREGTPIQLLYELR